MIHSTATANINRACTCISLLRPHCIDLWLKIRFSCLGLSDIWRVGGDITLIIIGSCKVERFFPLDGCVENIDLSLDHDLSHDSSLFPVHQSLFVKDKILSR